MGAQREEEVGRLVRVQHREPLEPLLRAQDGIGVEQRFGGEGVPRGRGQGRSLRLRGRGPTTTARCGWSSAPRLGAEQAEDAADDLPPHGAADRRCQRADQALPRPPARSSSPARPPARAGCSRGRRRPGTGAGAWVLAIRAASISRALSRSTACPYSASIVRLADVGLQLFGRERRHARGRRNEPRRHHRGRRAPRIEHGHHRLADAERGEGLFQIVEVGLGEGADGGAERGVVVRRMRPQRVLHPVAQLREHVVGHVLGRLGHEVHPDALGADEPHHLLHLVRNSFEASANSRCASSKKNASLGLGRSPASGRL